MTLRKSFTGRCHCGNLELVLETAKSADELGARACACSFCRRHAARTTSDPDGRARVTVRDATKLHRYRFGLHTADFLVCRDCGCYLGALFEDDGAAWITLNVNMFDMAGAFPATGTPVRYEQETAAARKARRRARWTPLDGVIGNR